MLPAPKFEPDSLLKTVVFFGANGFLFSVLLKPFDVNLGRMMWECLVSLLSVLP
jgi:hypothetical protein